MSPSDSYDAAERLASAAHHRTDMASSIASGNADEATFSLIVEGAAFTVIVRPARYHDEEAG